MQRWISKTFLSPFQLDYCCLHFYDTCKLLHVQCVPCTSVPCYNYELLLNKSGTPLLHQKLDTLLGNIKEELLISHVLLLGAVVLSLDIIYTCSPDPLSFLIDLCPYYRMQSGFMEFERLWIKLYRSSGCLAIGLFLEPVCLSRREGHTLVMEWRG